MEFIKQIVEKLATKYGAKFTAGVVTNADIHDDIVFLLDYKGRRLGSMARTTYEKLKKEIDQDGNA